LIPDIGCFLAMEANAAREKAKAAGFDAVLERVASAPAWSAHPARSGRARVLRAKSLGDGRIEFIVAREQSTPHESHEPPR
jgi:hypothetical protein